MNIKESFMITLFNEDGRDAGQFEPYRQFRTD